MTNAKSKLIKLSVLAAIAAVAPLSSARAEDAANAPDGAFKKFKLSDKFYSEGCTWGDFNKDGVMDYYAGPYWYEGPDFQKRHTVSGRALMRTVCSTTRVPTSVIVPSPPSSRAARHVSALATPPAPPRP